MFPPLPPPKQAAPPVAEAPQGRNLRVFWRRVLALLLDAVVLGILGSVAGWPLFDWFASLGDSGRWLGFGVAALYFGILNSSIGGGQTLGKRVMDIEVIDRTGQHVTPVRSCLRFFILGVPFFLNGSGATDSWLSYVEGFVVFAGGVAILYLFLFNRRTRQSLHDLICGTFVARTAPEGAVLAPPVWRAHLVVVAALSVMLLAATLSFAWYVPRSTFPDMIEAREQLLATGDFRDAGLFAGRSWTYGKGGRHQTDFLTVNVLLRRPSTEYARIARQVAELTLANYPDAKARDILLVRMAYGYDIGIARAWISQTVQHTPAQWAGLIAGQTTKITP